MISSGSIVNLAECCAGSCANPLHAIRSTAPLACNRRPSLERVIPTVDRRANLVRRILLDEVTALDSDLALIGPASAELALPTDQNRSRLGVDEKFCDRALREPRSVFVDQR